MGQEITYCRTCQTQLRSADLEKGQAYRIDGAVYCKGCAPTVNDTAPPPAQATAEHPPSAAPAPATRRSRAAPGGSGAVVFAVCGVAVVVILGVVAASSGSGGKARQERTSSSPLVVEVPAPRSDPPKPAAAVELPPAPTPTVRKPDVAKESLRKAREFAQAHPADLPGQLALYDQAAWDARETEFLEAARSEREAVVRRQREAFAAQAKTLDDSIRPRIEREEFGSAIAAWKEARSAQASPEWTAMVDRNAADIRARAEALLASLQGKGTPPDELRRRVARWGLPDLEKLIADAPPPVVPPRPVPAAGADPVQKPWRLAMDLASARDYVAAIAVLEKARQEAASPAHKAELTADLEGLRALAAAIEEIGKALARLPKGQKVAVTFVNDAGKAQRVEGVCVHAEPGRLIVRMGDETAVVPVAEITAGSLAELLQGRGGGRPAFLLCCLEGDLEGLKKVPADALPPKYAALGAEVAQQFADPELQKRDTEARRLAAAGEAETSVPSTAAGGAEKLARLLKEFGDLSYVKRNLSQFRARLEAAKDLVFGAEMMQATGSFKPARSAKSGPCWSSEADSPPAQQNHVELEFAPIPGLEYRCWVYVGACCAETFEFFYQATELAGFEPGSAALAPAKHAISTAVRKHSAHQGPKQPARWGWVALPLPKFSQPGAKRIRILTEQAGFSVGFAVVSATRAAAPAEADFKEWERQRSVEMLRPPADPSLVGYYTLDGSGTTVTDATRNGNHGQVRPGAAWAVGKFGRSLEFDGVSGHVRIPSSASFNTVSKQVTIAAWVYRKSAASGWKTVVCRQLGVSYEDQWSLGFNADTIGICVGPGRGLVVPGAPQHEWTHVAGTFDGTTLLLYKNGTLAGRHKLPAPWEIVVEPKPVTIGASFNDASDNVMEHLHALIDEVRIYNRALPAAEIAALARWKP